MSTRPLTFNPLDESPPSRTGKAYSFCLYQISEGDVVLWNKTWHTVQVVVRTPDAPAHRQVTLHTNFGTITGEEQTQVTTVPRTYVIR